MKTAVISPYLCILIDCFCTNNFCITLHSVLCSYMYRQSFVGLLGCLREVVLSLSLKRGRGSLYTACVDRD